MSIWYRTRRVLTRDGFAGLLMKVRIVLFDHWFDFRHGVDTCRRESLEHLRIESGNRRYGNRYEPSRVLPMIWFLRQIQSLLPESRTLVDMGSGKGRVLLIASQFGFGRVKGIEFARELSQVAQDNCRSFKQSTGVATEFQVIQGDATSYLIVPEDTVFFFFNPFKELVLTQVLQNIDESWQQYPRKMVICCYNTPLSEHFDRMKYFARRAEYNFWGYQFLVYGSRATSDLQQSVQSASAEQEEAVEIVHPH